MKNIIMLISLVSIHFTNYAQKRIDVKQYIIPEAFTKDVGYVTVDRKEAIEVVNQNNLQEKVSETLLILNQSGVDQDNYTVYYSQLAKIKSIQLRVYNANGDLLKHYKEKDFRDISVADGFSLFTDGRLKTIDINQYSFPLYTIFEYELEKENTLVIPPFAPIEYDKDRIVNFEYTLKFPANTSIKPIEKNLEKYQVQKNISSQTFTYQVSNLMAPEYEDMNIRYVEALPIVKFENTNFGFGKIQGKINNWDDFGKWYYDNFLKGLNELSPATVAKMKDLTKDATTDVEKAKIIFDYVQNNTRYISIQIGLGGWKPYPAKEVDRLGYGDCKALTNYTKALLESVGVETYYTIIHASPRIVDIDEKYLSLQGNHVVLTLPTPTGNIFIESTSQKIPFGYLGGSTDNRKALAIKPDGAFFVDTHSNKETENVLKCNFKIDLTDLNKVYVDANLENYGSFYQSLFQVDMNDSKEINLYLKNLFSSVKDLSVKKYEIQNNKNQYVYNELIAFESSSLGAKMGNDYLIGINAIYQPIDKVKRYRNRKTDFMIARGVSYDFTSSYKIPEGFTLSFVPESKNLVSKFGHCNIDFKVENNNLHIAQTYILKSGEYKKEDYVEFEKFNNEVLQVVNTKFIITKTK